MTIIEKSQSVTYTRFFDPLTSFFSKLTQRRACPELSDQHWLHIGISRVLHEVKSGRDFLQTLRTSMTLPGVSHFFSTLRSTRRLALCSEANGQLVQTMKETLPDPFKAFPSLAGFDIHAADGQSHAAAVHDAQQRSESSSTGMAKFATSHVYALNMRTHGLTHVSIADQITRRREHEIRALKRLTLAAFRQKAPEGRKVLYVYDMACVDYTFWYKLKQGGVYFLTRAKSNTSMLKGGTLKWDPSDPVNAGVLFNEQAGVGGVMVRHVQYRCPLSGEVFDYLTNEMTIPPGLIARLCKMRWDLEKVYDELKNKLDEKKAWAGTPAGKTMQAVFICLAHNLMVLQEYELEKDEGVTNTSEIKRKAKRLALETARLAEKGETMPVLLRGFQRLTQRSVKHIRWLRACLFHEAPWHEAVAVLRLSYATF